MFRLQTENINIGYGEHLIVKDLSVEIPDKKSQPSSDRMAVESLHC